MVVYYAHPGTVGSLQQALTEARAMVKALETPDAWVQFMENYLPTAVQGLLESPCHPEITVTICVQDNGRLSVDAFECPKEESC